MEVGIITCGCKKKDNAAAAKDFYTGTAFTVYRDYMIENFDHWVILSAKYGLVLPDQIVSPYNTYIKDLDAEEKYKLADTFCRDLKQKFPDVSTFKFYVSDEYKKVLLPHFDRYNINAEFPLDGLPYGKKLHFMRTGNDKTFDLNDLVQYLQTKLDPNGIFTIQYLQDLVRYEYSKGEYPPTYCRRRIHSLTVNEGDPGMKNYPLFYKLSQNKYCFKDSETLKNSKPITKKLF